MEKRWLDNSYGDNGELLVRHIPGTRKWFFLELLDWRDHMSRAEREELSDTYHATLYEVDLDAISDEDKNNAIRYCGWDGTPEDSDAAVAQYLHEYGNHAPLWDLGGNDRRKLLREGKREARSLEEDAGKHAEALERPVNKIGSTAAEYMRGDMDSALTRGLKAGDQTTCLVAKIEGKILPPPARPDDFLPFVMGYMDARHGRKKEEGGDELAKEYHDGYDCGVRVREGRQLAPTWISEQGSVEGSSHIYTIRQNGKLEEAEKKEE